MTNKPIATQELLDVAGEVFSRGWPSVKLYFMIGHPTQSLEDVEAIADLAHQVRRLGFQALGRRSMVRVGVSTLVPKAHTPFQWLPMADENTIRQQIGLLERRLRGPGLDFSWNDPRETLLEAALSRGDRRLSDVIQRAWELGAGFDGWGDQFNEAAWSQAFRDMGLDPDWYARRARALDEVLPWDHIHAGVSKAFLAREYRKAAAGQVTADCRQAHKPGRAPDQAPWPQPASEPRPTDAAAVDSAKPVCHACGIVPLFREEQLLVGHGAWHCPPARRRSTCRRTHSEAL